MLPSEFIPLSLSSFILTPRLFLSSHISSFLIEISAASSWEDVEVAGVRTLNWYESCSTGTHTHTHTHRAWKQSQITPSLSNTPRPSYLKNTLGQLCPPALRFPDCACRGFCFFCCFFFRRQTLLLRLRTQHILSNCRKMHAADLVPQLSALCWNPAQLVCSSGSEGFTEGVWIMIYRALKSCFLKARGPRNRDVIQGSSSSTTLFRRLAKNPFYFPIFCILAAWKKLDLILNRI